MFSGVLLELERLVSIVDHPVCLSKWLLLCLSVRCESWASQCANWDLFLACLTFLVFEVSLS